MIRSSTIHALLLTGALAVALASCRDSSTIAVSTRLDSLELSIDQVLAIIDTSLTYQHKHCCSRADSVMRNLISEGVPVKRSFLALDYMCYDNLGATLNVELTSASARILELDFQQGAGPLGCAKRYREYWFE